MDHVIGLAGNSRLADRIRWHLDDAGAEAERKGRAARRYTGVSLRHPEELVMRAPRHRECRASGRQGEPPLRVAGVRNAG